jgi:alpha-galactosidase
LEITDLPSTPPDDAVMAPKAMVDDMDCWTAQAFGVSGSAVAGANRIGVRVVRQDHSSPQFGRSCMDTPLRIGSRDFEHGLGTHAFSEIRVAVPKGAGEFKAFAGIDNNYDTQGSKGSAEFIVELDGKEAARTPVLRGSDAGVAVSVAVDDTARELVLKVTDGGDGPGCDQADWADAQFVMGDGTVRQIDEDQSRLPFAHAKPPFSFTYNGVSSDTFLDGWKHDARFENDHCLAHWTDPATGLYVTAEAFSHSRFPATEWVLYFENRGSEDTPLIEDVQAMDIAVRTGDARKPLLLHELEGDACGATSFLPKTTPVNPGDKIDRAPSGGRSSSISAFPFFTTEYGNEGLIVAIGWTGQWASRVERVENGPVRLRAGMELTRLVLHPGERIRTPRILVMAWEGDRANAQNQFRRLMLLRSPQEQGRPVRLPVALQTFDRYNARPEWTCEAGQVKAVDTAHELGCDTYWFDAAWFPKHFPNGVGSWFAEPKEFPRGLKPIADRCHGYGMKFIVWFEPERVAKDTQISNEHPEFVFGGRDGGLFMLNDPKARRYLTDMLSQRIEEYGIDVYRNDFNMDPLPYWRANDAPDRQGMTEIRYIEGLYEMWDELLAQHPGLVIDNCSSGGRRIDMEMCSRSVPLWRSDTNCSRGNFEWKQAQSMSLTRYVPLQTACMWALEAHDERSAATGGLLCQLDYLAGDFAMPRAKELIAEAKERQKYWYGDFYALTPVSNANDQFAAWQFHRADLDEGIVLAFRREQCPQAGIIGSLGGIDPAGRYTVEMTDEKGTVTQHLTDGKELQSNLVLRIPERGQSLAVKYGKIK